MAAIDLSILYQDYIARCKSSNIIPLCMTKWYDQLYDEKNITCKQYVTVEEVLEEINKVRAFRIY